MLSLSSPERPDKAVMNDPLFMKIIRGELSDAAIGLPGNACRSIVRVAAQADVADIANSGKQLYVLLDGWACKYRLMADGRRQLLRLHLPGEIFNLDALCGTAVADVLALTDCRLAVVSLDWVRALVAERPATRDSLWSSLAREIAVMSEQLFSLGRRSARERTAFFLCDILERLEAIGEAAGGTFRLPMTQVDMGDHLGLSTVHINRTLQDLRSEQLIRHTGRTFTVCNREELERLAGYRHGAAPVTTVRRA